MKKVLYTTIFAVFSLLIFESYQADAIPNPWIDCDDDISCGAKKAGFNFPLQVKNYSVRAMVGLMQITFPLDKKRSVTVRKSEKYDGNEDRNGIKDISGDYNYYPVNKAIKLPNGVYFNVRGNKNKFYVANFAAETGYYSFSCDKGFKLQELNYFYKLLEEAEAPRYTLGETKIYTVEQLRNSRQIEGIVEPVYTQDCFPRTLQKKGVTKVCFENANLGQDIVCSTSEIKMIKEYYKRGQKKDPLNGGSGNFCAKD